VPGAVVVQEYDPDWPRQFERLRAAIWPAVADIAASIEHVGSTSVPGLAAKPVIDMDVVVPPDRIATGIERLTSIGYEHRGDLGIPGREAFRPFDHSAPPKHHLYMCSSDSPALANHLAVRDYLRANPEAALEYGRLKRALAKRFADDMDGYVQGKTGFLLGILRASGCSEDAVADVERMNARD
jgi:GrpB-like predicted nucleotidyltransferase (UPF0157 family)